MCVEPTEIPQQKQGLGIWVVMTRLNNRYEGKRLEQRLETPVEIPSAGPPVQSGRQLTWESRVICDRRRLGYVKHVAKPPLETATRDSCRSRRG